MGEAYKTNFQLLDFSKLQNDGYWLNIKFILDRLPNLLHLSNMNRINSLRPEWRIYVSVNSPSLVQIIACRLIGAKPLSEPMLEYC